MKKLILIFLLSFLCCLVVNGQTTNQEKYLTAFLIGPDALLQYHSIGDKPIIFIDNSNNDFFRVALIKKRYKRYFVRITNLSITDSYACYGWLNHLSVGITFKSNEIALYERCNKSSNSRELIVPLGTTIANVLNFRDNGWMKISFDLYDSHFIGWLPPEFQCDNYFTMCCGN